MLQNHSWASCPLDHRERHMAQLVADGATNRQISRTVNLSEDHVAHVISGMMRKISASNRANLVWECARMGILPHVDTSEKS